MGLCDAVLSCLQVYLIPLALAEQITALFESAGLLAVFEPNTDILPCPSPFFSTNDFLSSLSDMFVKLKSQDCSSFLKQVIWHLQYIFLALCYVHTRHGICVQ